jgi:hemerythrin
MALYQWDPALETGNAAIDEQHRRLFALANSLAEAIATCPMTDEGLCEEDENTLANAIYGLTDYCVEHFADEEELMASYEYPRLSTHRSLHEELSGETLKRAAEYFNDDGIVPETLAPLFAEWLANHILIHDMSFAAYRRERESAE